VQTNNPTNSNPQPHEATWVLRFQGYSNAWYVIACPHRPRTDEGRPYRTWNMVSEHP